MLLPLSTHGLVRPKERYIWTPIRILLETDKARKQYL